MGLEGCASEKEEEVVEELDEGAQRGLEECVEGGWGVEDAASPRPGPLSALSCSGHGWLCLSVVCVPVPDCCPRERAGRVRR